MGRLPRVKASAPSSVVRTEKARISRTVSWMLASTRTFQANQSNSPSSEKKVGSGINALSAERRSGARSGRQLGDPRVNPFPETAQSTKAQVRGNLLRRHQEGVAVEVAGPVRPWAKRTQDVVLNVELLAVVP